MLQLSQGMAIRIGHGSPVAVECGLRPLLGSGSPDLWGFAGMGHSEASQFDRFANSFSFRLIDIEHNPHYPQWLQYW